MFIGWRRTNSTYLLRSSLCRPTCHSRLNLQTWNNLESQFKILKIRLWLSLVWFPNRTNGWSLQHLTCKQIIVWLLQMETKAKYHWCCNLNAMNFPFAQCLCKIHTRHRSCEKLIIGNVRKLGCSYLGSYCYVTINDHNKLGQCMPVIITKSPTLYFIALRLFSQELNLLQN